MEDQLELALASPEFDALTESMLGCFLANEILNITFSTTVPLTW